MARTIPLTRQQAEPFTGRTNAGIPPVLGHGSSREGRATEAFHLGHARHLYATDRLSVEDFEAAAAHVLSGGTLDRNGHPNCTGPAYHALPLDQITT